MEGPKCVRGVAWYNKEELEVVCAKVFSTEMEERQWAVERMLVWQARSHPKTPVAIDVTASIVRAQICDELQKTSLSSLQHTNREISHLYAMGIIRFVNLISELGQNSDRKTAVRYLAQKFKIPGWMVDLRHQSTHSATPSLEMLRVGAEFALYWLKLRYWDVQREAVGDWMPPSSAVLSLKEADEEMRSLISLFQSHQNEVFQGHGTATETKMSELLFKLRAWLYAERCQLLTILAEPGNMLPTALQLQSLLCVSADSMTSLESLPLELEKYWLPVISLMYHAQVLQQFLELLLSQNYAENLLHQRIAMAWIRKLLEAVTANTEQGRKETGKRISSHRASPLIRLVKRKPALQWKKLLETSLQAPNAYSPEIMTMILDRVDPPLTQFQKHHLMALVAIYIGRITGESGKDIQLIRRVFPVEELIKTTVKAPQQLAAQNTSGEDVFNMTWEYCSGSIKWDTYPLGSILDESVTMKQHHANNTDFRDSPLREDTGVFSTAETLDRESMADIEMAELTEDDDPVTTPTAATTELILGEMCMHLKCGNNHRGAS